MIQSNPIQSTPLQCNCNCNLQSNSNAIQCNPILNPMQCNHNTTQSDSIEAYGIFNSIESSSSIIFCLVFWCLLPKDIIVHDPSPWGLFHWIWGLSLFLHIYIYVYIHPKRKEKVFCWLKFDTKSRTRWITHKRM